MKRVALLLALSWSGASFGGTTANIGAVSEYMLRGIEGSGGTALQGGIDWTGERGGYAGTWASNTGGPAAAGATEIDFYGGWAGRIGSATLDVGAVYYFYTEDEEDLGLDYDYPEVYAKAGLGGFTLQLYYATNFFGDANEAAANLAGEGNDGLYVNALGTFAISPTLNLGVQIGHSSGAGVEVAWGDSYADYSVALTKTLEGGLSFSFGLYDTTLKAGQGFGTLPSGDDEPKAVIGVKKTFDL
ncbi:MAG: TorF family putative porin [Nevskiaceae bacterium]